MVRFLRNFSNPFKKPSLEEIVENEIRRNQLEVQQCEAVIRAHKLQRHLARRAIDALKEWDDMEKKEKEQGNNL
jgi:hypothetical protein